MSTQETRLLPLTKSMSTEYAFVSMPPTAWYWLDDLVNAHYPAGGYKALIEDINVQSVEEIPQRLQEWVHAYCDSQMSSLYALANDNDYTLPKAFKRNAAHPGTPDYNARMPTVYQLFRFMPHATYLTTVWERRNYHLRGDFL